MAKNEPEVQAPYDPMKDLVTVVLPYESGSEDDYIPVGLNGKLWRIKRGEAVRVPRPVADILAESQRLERRQREYQLEMAKRAREGQRRVWGG